MFTIDTVQFTSMSEESTDHVYRHCIEQNRVVRSFCLFVVLDCNALHDPNETMMSLVLPDLNCFQVREVDEESNIETKLGPILPSRDKLLLQKRKRTFLSNENSYG